MKYYICKHCGNIIAYEKKVGCDVKCCGEVMEELVPNTSDGAGEKHVPVVEVNGNLVSVKVGEVLHPMSEEHLIEWVSLETTNGVYTHHFNSTDQPIATFALKDDEEVIAAYEYCNLHGLWKKEVK